MEEEKKPSFWKSIVVNTAIVYPLILISEIILNFLLPMELLHPKFGIFLSVVIVVLLMAWPVMPFVHRILGDWLKE